MAIPNVTDEQLDILAGKQEQPVIEPVEGIGIQDATVTDQDIMPESIPAPEIDPEGQQVAAFGLGDLTTGIAKRVLEAEKKVMPPIPDKPIQEVGGQLLIREADPEEVSLINNALGGEYTKGINFPRIADNIADADMGDYLSRLKDANVDLFEKARRGTINFDGLLKMAEDQGIDHIVAEWLERSPGDGDTAEKVLGGLLGAMEISKEIGDTFSAARVLGDQPEEKAKMLTRAKQLMTMEAVLYANISGAASESARTMYVLRELGQRSGINVGERADELINIFGAENVQDIEYLGDLYMALPKKSRAKFVQQGMLSKSMDVVAEVWINSILTHPATHMVNVAGNSLFYGTRVAETALAGVIGKGRTALGIGGKDRVRMRESLVQLDAIRESFVDAMVVSGRTLFTEETADAASKIDTRKRRAIGTSGDPRVIMNEIKQGNFGAAAVNALGVYYRMGGRFLLAEDQFFKAIGYRSKLRQEAALRGANMYDEAIASGKTTEQARQAAAAEEARILLNPPQVVVQDAQQAAKELTFQGDLPSGLASETFAHPIAKLFVPFYRTPMNIMGETLKRSPVMLMYPGFHKKLLAGGRETDLAVAQVSLGSMIMGAFAMTSMGFDGPDENVIITGAGPSNPKARQAMLRKGIQPHSISLKNEDGSYTSVTYSRLDPVSGMLAMAADFAYYAQYEQDQSVLDNLGMAAVVGISEYAMQMPFLQGVSELTGALTQSDPAMRGEKVMELIGQKPTEAFLSFAPSVSAFSAGIERINDPTVGSYMLPEDLGDPTQMPAFMRGFYTALQKAKARNPFFSDSVPPRLNLWGETMMAGEGHGWEFVSPIRIKDTKYAPVDDELMRLGGGISMHPRKIDGVILNAEPYNEWVTLTNKLDVSGLLPGQKGYDISTTLLPTLSQLIKHPDYDALPTNDDRLQEISNVVGRYRKQARLIMLEGNPELQQRIEAVQ